jgi:hypothetical protein
MPAVFDLRPRLVATAGILVAICLFVGARAVSVGFERERHRLVTETTAPAADGSVVRFVPPMARPVSVVVVQAAGGETGGPMALRVNGRAAGSAELSAGKTRRFDFQVAEGIPAGAEVTVVSAARGWTLRYLEVANVHGFTRGLIAASIVPAAHHDYSGVSPWLLGVLSPLLVALALLRPAGSRWVRRLELGAQVLGLGPLTAAAIAPLVSRFSIVLAAETWLLTVVLLFGGRALRGYRAARLRARARASALPVLVDGAVVVALIAAFYASAVAFGLTRYGGDYSRFVALGDRFSQSPVLDEYPGLRESLGIHRNTPGYDGQFMYLMAFDPFLTRFPAAAYLQIADAPAYRYGRIGYSLLTRAFSWGNPSRFPRTMVWLVVLGHVAAGLFLVLMARQVGAAVWCVLAYVLVPGFIVSLANALPESIAAAFILAGLWAYRGSRRWLAVGCWSGALLVRETGVVLVGLLAAWEWWEGAPGGRAWTWTPARRRALLLILPLIPVGLWRLYVGWRLYPALGAEAFLHNPADLTVPFRGFAELWRINDAAHGFGQVYNVYFPLLLTALLALALWTFAVRRTPVAAAAGVYALVAVSLNVEKIWHWAGNAERGTFESFLLLLVAALPVREMPRALRFALALFAVATFVYNFQYGTHAEWFRPALLVFR